MKNKLQQLMTNQHHAFEQITNAKTKKEALEIAKKFFPDYTATDLKKDLTELMNGDNHEAALKLEELDAVVGGSANFNNFVDSNNDVSRDPFYRQSGLFQKFKAL